MIHSKISTQTLISGGGLVQYVSHMGSDETIDAISRPHTTKGDVPDVAESRTPEQVARLLNFMIRERHTSPFEFAQLVFYIECPIFIARQWMRHRTGSFSEQSARYTQLGDTYAPEKEHMRAASSTRKQGSSDDLVEDWQWALSAYEGALHSAKESFKELVAAGLANETARGVQPLATLTRFYWSVDLHNLLHFISLRAASDAQFQMQEYAQGISKIVERLFPITWAAYQKHVLNTVRVDKTELAEIVAKSFGFDEITKNLPKGSTEGDN